MKKVFISAGHGGKDPGAVANNLKEKDLNLYVSMGCKEILEKAGVKVFMSRIKDEDDPVEQEVKEANSSGADIAVSFHFNAGGGDGAEFYYYGGDENGRKLASLLWNAAKGLKQNAHGTVLKNGKELMFINSTYMTAVLVETAFIDSADIQLANTKAKCIKFGQAYANAILDYFNINPNTFSLEIKGFKTLYDAQKAINKIKGIGYNAEIKR